MLSRKIFKKHQLGRDALAPGVPAWRVARTRQGPGSEAAPRGKRRHQRSTENSHSWDGAALASLRTLGCGSGPAGGWAGPPRGQGRPPQSPRTYRAGEEGKGPCSGGGIQPHVYRGRRRLTAPALCEPRREEAAAAAAARGRAVRAAAAGPAAAPW